MTFRWHEGEIARDDRWRAIGQHGATVWLTGLSGSGKSTVAARLERRLVDGGVATYRLDGDNLRHGLNRDLGLSAEDRSENVRRVGEVARLLADAGLVVLVPIISPYAEGRRQARTAHEEASLPFVEVWVSAGVEVCAERDPKGLYAAARRGELQGLTGVDAPYEVPERPDVVIAPDEDLDASVSRLWDDLVARSVVITTGT